MNKIAVAVLGCILSMGEVCHASDKLTFTVVQPVSKAAVMDIKGISRNALNNALELHNLMVEVRGIENTEDEIVRAVETRQFHEKKLAAMEKCSVDKLATGFKNPNEVWNKMTAEYAQKEKDLAIYINSSQTATEQEIQNFNAYMESGEMTDDVVSELLSPWAIGREILTDVYANQDAWGERASEDSPSFPLWEDQKYIFDKEWNKKYEAINLYFGVPPQGRPVIGDEKYDYAKAKKLEKAHATYLAALMAKNPAKAAAIPSSLKQAPVAPKPLPPKQEHLVYLDAADPKKAIYPSLPEPWQEYEKSNFKDINPTGEMAEDFSSGLNLKEEAKKAPQANRLVIHSAFVEDVEGAKRYENVILKNAMREIDFMKNKISKYIELDADADLLNADAREKVLGQLQQKYKELVIEAEKEISERNEEDDLVLAEMDLSAIEDLAQLKEINPAAFEEIKTGMPNSLMKRDEVLLAALKKDEEGRVFLNEVNAGDIDKMLKETTALKAFMKEQLDINLNAEKPIDESCLNGGV